jgi:hypothetical protein
MTQSPSTINPTILESLFAPWAEPNSHRVRAEKAGEAVDSGIVKTPLIGQATRKLVEQADDNAAYRWEQHLLLGYDRWQASKAEWEASGKKTLLFIKWGTVRATHRCKPL